MCDLTHKKNESQHSKQINKYKEKIKATIDSLEEKKLITKTNGILQLTPAGLVVENEIITRLSL